MEKKTLAGVITGLVLMFVFMAGLGMNQDDNIFLWFINGFQGITFFFAFGFGLPPSISMVLSFAIFLCAFGLGFFIGKKLFTLTKNTN